MATFIETKSNQIIVDQAVASGDYINLSDGYIPKYGSEFNLTFSGTQLYIGTGMLTQNGVKVINDAPLTVEVGTSTSAVTKKVYLKIDMANPTNVTAVVSASTTTLPRADIFSLYANGVANVLIGTFTLNSGGVSGVSKYIEKASVNSDLGIERVDVITKNKIYVNTNNTIDVTRYKRLRFHLVSQDKRVEVFDLSLDAEPANANTEITYFKYITSHVHGCIDVTNRIWSQTVAVNAAKNVVRFHTSWYKDFSHLGNWDNYTANDTYIYKIEGIY